MGWSLSLLGTFVVLAGLGFLGLLAWGLNSLVRAHNPEIDGADDYFRNEEAGR
jgi:hypothetical protein